MKSLIGIAIMSVLLSGCLAKAGRTSGVTYGMSKQEVVAVMGPPVSVSAQGNSQYLNYSICDTDNQTPNGMMRPYVVRLIDGRVESYGASGDGGSSPMSSGRHDSDQNVKQDTRTKEPGDLYTELMKLKELKDSSVITEEEFRSQKRRILERR